MVRLLLLLSSVPLLYKFYTCATYGRDIFYVGRARKARKALPSVSVASVALHSEFIHLPTILFTDATEGSNKPNFKTIFFYLRFKPVVRCASLALPT